MKKFKRITAWLLCVCTTAAMLPTGAALTDVNWTWGNITASKEITVAPEATYRALTVDSPVGIQRVNAIEFNPKNQHTKLRAGLSNGKVNGVQTVLGMANDMNKKHPGQVVAGINGDYFHLGQGVPFGIFMDEGEILSTPPQYSTAFGIKKDGTPFVVSHGSILDETLHIGDKKFALTGINNRHEDENSLIMYTDTFGSSTRAKKDSVEAVCVVMSGEPKHGETMKLKVKSLRASGGNAPIGENEVVLSGVGTRKNDIAYLKEGYEVSVTLKFNQFWSDVEFAIAGNRLLVSEGEVRQLSGSERAPRTVIGLKPDGKVVFYTIDGRMSGYSVGATFMQAGRIMKDLGCSYAMNLDGGGSTTFVMREPGDAMHKLINRPSDGEMRQVANGVILMNSAPVGEAKTLLIKQSGRKVLKGGTYQYSVAAIDANIQPKELDPAKTMWDVEPMHGTISAGGAFNATGAGMASIKVANETAKGVTTTEVIDAITAITPVKANIKIDANATKQVGVTLKRGNDSVEFTNNLLKWSVEGAIGKIDAEGKLTAGRAAATGNVVVSYGGIVKKIPVTVSGPEPEVFEKFKDMGTHRWAKTAVYHLFDAGVVRGVTDSAFAPAKPIKRADFILMLMRLMKIDTSADPTDNFKDVPKSAYYYKELGAAKKLGIAEGTSDNTFSPERSITRQEMFTLTCRVLKKSGVIKKDAPLSAADMFTDAAKIAPYARQPIATLTQNKLIEGDAKGKVNPSASASRAEGAVFLERVRVLIEKSSKD